MKLIYTLDNSADSEMWNWIHIKQNIMQICKLFGDVFYIQDTLVIRSPDL